MEKLVANLHDKTEYAIHIRDLKEALNHGLVSKKCHKVIEFNQNTWLQPYIDMNTDLKKMTFSSRSIIQILEKLWKMWENIQIINLSQQKQEGII